MNETSEASKERELQRSESEARDIIHDVERLYTIPEEKKTRWIWELMQNAKDVATSNGINIECSMLSDKLEFSHDGEPFSTKNLLAILYKTSTKSLSGDDGSTGKYGTGFVTTHVLNRKLTVSGVHKNERGQRFFELEIDRTPTDIPSMQKVLSDSFLNISTITEKQSVEGLNHRSSFKYNLNEDTVIYAKRGIQELSLNLAFTLLINSRISSVTIADSSSSEKITPKVESTQIESVKFISLEGNQGQDYQQGLLYCQKGKLTFGIPAQKKGRILDLKPITNQAILFKEFPLIGTELFNLPVFIQHEDFLPTEQRDGIRTKIVNSEVKDSTALQNRVAMEEFVLEYIPFMEKLIREGVNNTHLLAKSGLPDKIENYSNEDWYKEKVQSPIRTSVLSFDLVKTASGNCIPIRNARFISLSEPNYSKLFELVSELIPEVCPSADSYEDWAKAIEQNTEYWPEGIALSVSELLAMIPEKLDLNMESSYNWLNRLYTYLNENNYIHLGDSIPIYPNENGVFCVRDEICIHPNISDEFKFSSKGMGRDLDNEFLDRRITFINSIKSFELQEFYKLLNSDIGKLRLEDANQDNISAIFHICCLFKSEQARKRNVWFEIIKELFPNLAKEKKLVSIDNEYSWKSAEHWAMKYVCSHVQKSIKPSRFSEIYFDGDQEVCFVWLNKFLSYVFGAQEESREVVLKYSIIPTQNDEFKVYDDSVFVENETKYFDRSIKDLYLKYTGKGDPRRFIVDNRISIDDIRKRGVDVLTKEIDHIFDALDIHEKVKKGGELNSMFLELNNWYESFSTSSTLLPKFAAKRNSLYVLALGEGFSQKIVQLNKLGRSIDDITELAEIDLSPAEMKKLQDVASQIGTDKLLAKAKEMIEEAEAIKWRKEVGSSAEEAFIDAIEGLDTFFDIDNPDCGMDFILSIGDTSKKYYVEIKSTVIGKESIKMSRLQGVTAVDNKENYALCVINRPSGEIVLKDYFVRNAVFVTDIGSKIGDSIKNWDAGLRNLKKDTDVSVQLEKEDSSVYIKRDAWKNGKSFMQFINHLNFVLK